ncbi:single-stranded DNA-binding protein [Magnetovirga frankeli]|nr:single-stranded DNA-binding protein [gamma proteobacterium SS-5]
MSKGTINKIILIGNLGADPEVRSMPSSNYMAKLRVATTETWKGRKTGITMGNFSTVCTFLINHQKDFADESDQKRTDQRENRRAPSADGRNHRRNGHHAHPDGSAIDAD